MVGTRHTGMVDRACGALLGLAVGDRLGGHPTQIRAGQDCPVDDHIAGEPRLVTLGSGTDATTMTLVLARSAATAVGYDVVRALSAYLEWFRSAPPEVGPAVRAAQGVAAGLSPATATEAFHRETGRSEAMAA